jgi:TetR/AcrR family transcriptional repressor of bet genes
MPEAKSAREQTKARHRRALIEATADAIAEHGLAAVSVSRILEKAGLSRGMVNLHFSSKNNLLLSVAEQFSEDYTRHWIVAMEGAGIRPEAQLRAIIDADFDPVVLNRRTMAVWFAFRGEAHSSPEFMPFIDSRDAKMQRTITSICRELCKRGANPGTDPQIAALSIIALLEGLWTDYYLHPDRFDRDTARAVVLHTARAFFPETFEV